MTSLRALTTSRPDVHQELQVALSSARLRVFRRPKRSQRTIDITRKGGIPPPEVALNFAKVKGRRFKTPTTSRRKRRRRRRRKTSSKVRISVHSVVRRGVSGEGVAGGVAYDHRLPSPDILDSRLV